MIDRVMKVQLLYILDCHWCVKTEELVKGSLEELVVKAEVEKILIDKDQKARKYSFVGSRTVRINGKDVQKEVSKGQCLPCEELAEYREGTIEFVKQECMCGCGIYFCKGKQYPYAPKEMIKEAIEKWI
jgi:hypothetical protein